MSSPSVSSTGATAGSTLTSRSLDTITFQSSGQDPSSSISEYHATPYDTSLDLGEVVADPTYAIDRFSTDIDNSQPQFHTESEAEAISAHANHMVSIIENLEAVYNMTW